MKKSILLVLILSILVGCFGFCVQATEITETEPTTIFDPARGAYQTVNDVTEEVEELSEGWADPETEEEFIEHKQRVYESMVLGARGGVGYGFTYNSGFKTDYATGVTISYDIICPTKAGGNNANYLYLTATNRAAKGVEAYVSYYAQNDLEFVVFDWAQPEGSRWQVHIDYDDLSKYLKTKTIHGVSRQYLSVQSRTVLVGENTWQNAVFLQNADWSYDLIYSYTYSATLAEQQISSGAWWGPIVETFQNSYSNLNVIGFNNTYCCSADSNGNWSDWQLLSTDQATVRNDGLGFNVSFLDPNYGFGVY